MQRIEARAQGQASGAFASVRRLFSKRKGVSEKVVCILGMHRSGTSCLTGVLQERGIFLGRVYTESGANRKGNRENPDIIRLHKDLLAANGGTWDEPPVEVRWSDEHRTRRDKILQQYAGNSCWGFKDPRTLLALEGWLEAIPSLQLVGTFRHPLLVARSLERRSQFSLQKGIDLWENYNARLLSYHRQFQFPMVSFDRAETEYRQSLDELWRQLQARGFPLHKNQIEFFEETLRQATSLGDFVLPPSVQNMYDELQRIAL